MTAPTRGIGSDICPKCGGSDHLRTAVPIGNLLSLTCKTCAHVWTLQALDTPLP